MGSKPPSYVYFFKVLLKRPWRRGIVVIASAYRIEDPEFESRQGVRFFRNLYIAVLLSLLNMHCHCVHLRKKKCC
jgi:hypothetical protein